MALFESRKVKRLNEMNNKLQERNYKLLEENINLVNQMSSLRANVSRTGWELEKKICDECGLSPEQIAKVKFLFSIERARFNGVPEDKILHSIDEINAFFTGGS
jgi:hypothetical protein